LRPNDSARRLRRKMIPMAASLIAATIALAGCGGDGDQADAASQDTVTVKNCGEEITFPSPAEKLYVANNQMLSFFFALDADKQISAVSGLSSGVRELITPIYGANRIEKLPFKTEDYPSLETVLAAKPDGIFAGIGWGFNEETGVIPARLIDDYDIPAYTLTTTCLQGSEEKKGIMPPWDAVTTDLENIAKVTGREDIAQSKLSEIQKRRDDLESAPKPKSPGTVFFYDITVKDGVLAGGALSAGHAIIEDAGGRNALEDIDEELTTVAWERLAADRPDFFLISDYGKGPYSYEGKVKDLKTNPATKDLPAVREGRFLRLPAPMLLGTPLMIDSAELLRKALEDEGLAPESEIEPELEIHD